MTRDTLQAKIELATGSAVNLARFRIRLRPVLFVVLEMPPHVLCGLHKDTVIIVILAGYSQISR